MDRYNKYISTVIVIGDPMKLVIKRVNLQEMATNQEEQYERHEKIIFKN